MCRHVGTRFFCLLKTEIQMKGSFKDRFRTFCNKSKLGQNFFEVRVLFYLSINEVTCLGDATVTILK